MRLLDNVSIRNIAAYENWKDNSLFQNTNLFCKKEKYISTMRANYLKLLHVQQNTRKIVTDKHAHTHTLGRRVEMTRYRISRSYTLHTHVAFFSFHLHICRECPRDGSTSLISIAWETFNTAVSKAHVHRPISSREETVNSCFSVTSFRPTRWSRSACVIPRFHAFAAFCGRDTRSRSATHHGDGKEWDEKRMQRFVRVLRQHLSVLGFE